MALKIWTAVISMKPSRNISLTFGINGSLRKREEQAQASYTEYYLFNSAANLKAYSYDGLDFAYYGYKNEVNRIKAMQNDNCDAIISDVYSAIDLAVSSDMRKKMINDIITNEGKNNLCEYGGIVRSGEKKIDDEIIDEIFIDWGKGETWKGAGHNAEFDYNTCAKHGTPLLFFHSHFPGKDKNGIGIEQEPSSFDLKNVSEHEARRNRANIVISTENNMVYLINNNKKYYEMNINVYINITNIYTPSRK